jgi:hypothetical protein
MQKNKKGKNKMNDYKLVSSILQERRMTNKLVRREIRKGKRRDARREEIEKEREETKERTGKPKLISIKTW